ncbi:MAG: universal stress protein [Dehalococcoidia bacterium]|nr:universal stress protein [Dehalococcoidia bacterium]
MYKRILVPLDGSELAERALAYARAIAVRSHSEVVLLTVSAPDDTLELPLRAYLEKQTGELSSSGVEASPLIVQGDAAEEILNLAETNYVDLIIISAHGRSGATRWNLGNIASKVLQKSPIPTILIRSSGADAVPIEKELGSILVTLDGSRFAEAVIPYAVGLAEAMDSEIALLRIIEPVTLPRLAGYGQWVDWDKYERDLSAQAQSEARIYLDNVELGLQARGLKVSSTSLSGKPAQAILQYAEDRSVGLIALSTHGFSGIARWAYGSVASRIIEGSPRPVLLVRPPPPPSDA